MTDETLERPAQWFGSLGSVIQLLVLTWAAGLASFPLNDNSFFTHLATGRLILDNGSIPSVDPYTFTAAGRPWTVQSWLASVAYAGAEQLGGVVGIRVLVLAIFLGAMSILWALSGAAESLLLRVGIMSGAVLTSALWSERPYMIGVIGLGVVLLALERRVPPWCLAPLLWVWVNTHGSFPLAVVLIGAVAGGEILDQRRHGHTRGVAHERRVLRWTLAGLAAGAVNPLGPKLLFFPVKALTQSSVLSSIVEWNPPQFDSLAERAFLLLFLLAIAATSRLSSWRSTLPIIIFGGAAVYAQRNIVMAIVVFVPVLAAAAPEVGTLRVSTRPSLGPALTLICLPLCVAVAVVALGSGFTTLGAYPVRGLAFLEATEPAHGRLATEDFTGNLLELLDGPAASVFVDDRADMFPAAFFADYDALVQGRPAWETILHRYDVDWVLWQRERAVGSLLAASPDWHVRYSDTHWVLACRRSVC